MFSKIKINFVLIFRSFFVVFILLSLTINFKSNVKVEANNPNLKHFGYFNDYDDGSKSIPNGFAELGNLNNSNIVHFNLSGTNLVDNQYFFNKAKLANLKTIPGIESIFGKYYADTTTNYTDQDFENSFQFLENILQGYEDQVLALYIQDEPNFDGVRADKFVDLTLRLKNRFPNYRRLITYAYTQLIGSTPGWLPATSSLITNITDVGFDGYKFTGFPTTNAGRQPYVTALANIANKGQNLWLVPDATDAQPKANCILGSGTPDKVYLTNAINDYYQLALNNPRVVGMYNFLWDVREIPELNWIDSRRMFDTSDPCYSPNVKQAHINIGQNIINSKDNCSYSQLPIVGADNNNWADKLNNYICQSVMVDPGANIGKLRSEITTDTGKLGIGTNNPSTPLAIVGLNEYSSETDAKTAGLKNGDLYRTGTQVKVVVGGDNIIEKPEIVNSDCGDNSTPNRLPIVGSDSNNWASILNHFLCNTMSNESGSEGKLKTNLANISADGKVGIGTIPVGVANFAVKGLPNYTNLSTANNAGSKNGDIYQTNGSLQVVNSSLSSNITIANSDDCYQSTATTRLPKPGQDATTWGDILNNFLCRSHLNGVNNAGKLKTDFATIVQGGKIGIGTNNPTSVLAIPNLPEFTDNQQAGLNIQVGSFYRTGNDVKVVY